MSIQKSYAQMLQELCSKSGSAPKITEESVSTNLCAPCFKVTWTVCIDNRTYEAWATATTKKMAKQNAAEKMLKEEIKVFKDASAVQSLLQPVNGRGSGFEKENVTPRPDIVFDEVSDYALNGNPIEGLSNFCEQAGLAHPTYSDPERFGPPHCPAIIIECIVGDLIIKGVQKQRKISKRVAADKMLTELKRREKTDGGFEMNLKPAAGDVGDPVMDEEKKHLKRLIEAAHDDPSSPCFRVPTKKLENMTREDSEREHEEYKEFCQTLGVKYTGPIYQELLKKYLELRQIHPVRVKHTEEIHEWLKEKSEGIMGFYQDLQDELKFTHRSFISSGDKEIENLRPSYDNDFSYNYMVFLTLDIPGFPKSVEPTFENFHNSRSKAEELCYLDAITYLAMIATRYL